MIGLSLGLVSGQKGDPTPAPPVDLNIVFGALTKAGAGGVPVSGSAVVSGDASGHWEIAAGHVVPTVSGATAGLTSAPYMLTLDNGQTIQITAEAGGFAVRTEAELMAISTAEAQAMTIRIREGAEINWGGSGYPGRRDSLGFATIIGDGEARTGGAAGYHFANLFVEDTWDVTFENVRVRHARPVSSPLNNFTGNLFFKRCHFGDGTFDPNGDYSASGAFAGAGGHDCFETGSGPIQGLSIVDCEAMNGGYGIQCRVDRWAEIIGNNIDTFYYDAIQITLETPNVPVIIAGNNATRPFGLASDADNPHTDGIQILGMGGGANVPDDSANLVIEGNAFSIGNSRNGSAEYSGGIFVKDIAASKGFGVLVRGNATHKLGFNDIRPTSVRDTKVEFNGCSPVGLSDLSGGKLSVGETFVSGTNDVSNNIAGDIPTNAGVTLTGNAVIAAVKANWDAALPNWLLPMKDAYSWRDMMGAFEGATGVAINKGPYSLVSLAIGAELSAFTMDATLAPVPILTSPLSNATGGVMSCAVTTNVSHNPIFWAVVSTGTSVTDARAIKERRITDALEYGYAAVTATGSVTLQGVNTHPSGSYEIVMYQENGWSKRSAVSTTSLTVSTAILTVNELARDKMVMDARIGLAGGGQARVALSGTATIGEVVQAYDRGAATWQDVATADGSGDWAGTLLSTNDDGDFQVAKTRLKSATATTADTTNTFATGTVFMPFGQSELDYMVNAFGGDSVAGSVAVTDADALQVIKIDNDETASPTVVHSFITADSSLTKAMAVLSNTLAAYVPNRKFLYVDAHHEGTSRWELMSDDENDIITGRRWSVLQQVIDWVRDNGSDIGQIVEMWFVADLAKQPFLDAWSPFYFGQTPAGATFTLGTTHTGGGVTAVKVDHCLFDMDVAADQRGRGAFTRADTRLAQMPPLPVIPRTGDLETSVTMVGGATAVEENSVKNLRQSYVDFHADSRTIEVAGDLMPNPFISKGYWNGTDWTNDTHPGHLIEEGTYLLAKHFARAVMIASGEVTVTPPVFSVNATDAAGAFVDLQLAGTGTLKTLRSIEAGITPTGETYYTDVAGFELIQGTVMIDGFTAVIQDAANRIVRITPDVAFVNDDKIRFGYGGGAGWYKTDSDGPKEWFKEFPLVDTGGAGLSYLFAEPWPITPEFTLAGISGGGGAATFTTSSSGPRFTDTANIPSGTTAMTFSAKVKDGFIAENSKDFINAASNTFVVQTLANRKIRVTAEANGSLVLTSASTPSAVIPNSGDFTLTVAIDLVAGWCKVLIDGVEQHEYTFTAAVAEFVSNRKISLLAIASGTTQVTGEFEYVKCWLSAETDGTEPASAPHALIEGPAATANAHPWKLGADAT